MTFTSSYISTKSSEFFFVGIKLSYELNNMRLVNMNMACCFCLRLQIIKTSFKEGYIIIGDEIVGSGIQFILVEVVTIISIVTGIILNSINVVVKCWRIELACGTSWWSFILAWNIIGSMWWNMMGSTCGSETTIFSTVATKLSMALRSPYKDYEMLRFSMSLSKSNCWFSFGSFSKYSSLL